MQPPASSALDDPASSAREALEAGASTRYLLHREHAAHIHGWFMDQAAALWDCLLSYQDASNIRGHLLEIGVHKGKSALLSALHTRHDEEQLLVDPAPLDEAIANIRKACPDTKLRAFPHPSRLIKREPLYSELASSIRWIHIDGSHTGQDVNTDLEIAHQLLAHDGIVTIDDFFDFAYPQITAATFAFMAAHPNAFALFLGGFGKGYLCRPLMVKPYLTYIKDGLLADMKTRGFEKLTLWKTTTPSDMNTFGITEWFEEFDRAYVGLD
jgi:hypothetical protein